MLTWSECNQILIDSDFAGLDIRLTGCGLLLSQQKQKKKTGHVECPLPTLKGCVFEEFRLKFK